MTSPLELLADLQLEWNEDQALRFYESEPLLAMVRMNDQWRYYTIGQNDYEKILFIIEIALSPQGVPVGMGSAEELWKSRTQYIGDNNAVGKIINLLSVPEGMQYDIDAAVKPNPFQKNALILLALVDNANGVRATLTDGKRELGFINAREWADYTVRQDVRNYAESPEKLQELVDFSITSMESVEEAVDFGAYPKDYSFEQGVNDGFFVGGCTIPQYSNDYAKVYDKPLKIIFRVHEMLMNKGYNVDMIMKELGHTNIKSPIGKERWSELHDSNHAHQPIVSSEVFDQVQEEIKRRSNVELEDGKTKRKNTHYSAKGIDESERDE